MSETTNDRLLKQKEVLERLSVGTTTLWRMVKDGKFPKPIKIAGESGKNLYKESWVNDFIARMGV